MATTIRTSNRSPADVAAVRESHEYTDAVRGVEIDVVRVGQGSGTTSVSNTANGRIVATSVSAGFPMASSAVIQDDVFAASVITRSAPDARWCGQPLYAGDVLVHGPETPHTAFNPEGLAFTFAVLPVADVVLASEGMGAHVEGLTGRLLKLPPTPAARRLGTTIAQLFPRTPEHNGTRERSFAALDSAVADALDVSSRSNRASGNRRISDGVIVTACIDAAVAAGRVPGIGEMRLAAHVSESRLRSAFLRGFGVSPSVFFRSWAVDQARRRLVAPGDRRLTVGTVATDLGFGHLGRFSSYYRRQFGEYPSATLARSNGKDPSATRR